MKFEWVVTFGNLISIVAAIGVIVRTYYSIKARLDMFEVWRRELEQRHRDSAGHFREMDSRVQERMKEMGELMEQSGAMILRTSAILEQIEKRLSRLEHEHDIIHRGARG